MPPRQIADERGFGELAERARTHGERGRVAELARPGVHVEVEPAGHLPILQHLECVHRRVPYGHALDPPEAHAQDAPGDVEDSLLDPVVRERAARLLGVEAVLLPPHHFRPVAALPPIDGRRPGDVLLLPPEQHGVLAGGGRPRGLDHAVDELGRVAPGPDHLVRGDVVRPVGEAEEPRQLVARLEQAVEHRHVLRPGAVVEGEGEPVAEGVAGRVVENRKYVRILGRDPDQAVRTRGVSRDEIRRKAGQLGRGGRDRVHVVPNVALEGL